jgi:hypothetical protein
MKTVLCHTHFGDAPFNKKRNAFADKCLLFRQWKAAWCLVFLLSAHCTFAQTISREERLKRTEQAEKEAALQNPPVSGPAINLSAPVALPFFDNFENGVGDWTAQGFFNLIENAQNTKILNPDINPALITLPDDGSLPSAYSGKGMWWFGEKATGTFIGSDFKNINQAPKNGGTSTKIQTGVLISPPINLENVQKAQLRFKTWWEIEGVDVDRYDLMYVEISTNGGTSYVGLGHGTINPLNDVNGEFFKSYSSGGLGLPGVWLDQLFDLSEYTGKVVQIRFRFNSRDNLYNGFRGWLIDDVSVNSQELPGPKITAINPSVSIANGLVSVTGTNFANGATVKVGSTLATAIISSGLAQVTVPNLSPGQYDVTITNPDGKSDTRIKGLTITNTLPPAVTSIQPHTTTCGKSVAVMITGANFNNSTAVQIGGLALANKTFVNANTITGQSPAALPLGNHNVRVTNPDGQFDQLISEFVVTEGDKTSQTINFPAISPKVYGNPVFALNASATSSLPVSLSVSSVPDGIATLSGTNLTLLGAGTVTVTASQAGDCQFNAALNVVRTFTVAKTMLTAKADDKSRAVGVANPPFTISYTGFVNGENAGVIDVAPLASTTATIGSPAGAYPIMLSGGIDNNYNFTLVNGTLTVIGVDKLNQTITFAPFSNKTYGDAPLALSATASSGLTVSFSVESGPGSILTGNMLGITGAGEVCVKASQAGNSTYNAATSVIRCFTVAKAMLTAKADDKTRAVGVANPPFTISYTGFVNGENAGVIDVAPLASTTATISSPAGAYPIVLSGGSDNNYNFTLVNGTLTVIEPTAGCTATGTILREYWSNVPGNEISKVPLHITPSSSSQLTLFEAPTNVANNYAARIRGYICAPASGSYTFWIASDDYSELYLSTDENPANKKLIAYMKGWANPRQWNKHNSQKAAPVVLEAGKRYYIEALHKEDFGGDNLAVGWQLPSGLLERPIAGSHLSPFITDPVCTAAGTLLRELWTNVSGDLVSEIPVNTDPNSTSQVTSFEGPINAGDLYGARYRGYLCIRESGGYRFWIASDNTSELWLSTDADPDHKVRIAHQLEGYNNTPRQWFKFGSQQSEIIQLEAGKNYYIEALHKEETGSDFLSVSWRMPSASGNSTPLVIPGSYLSPFISGNTRMELQPEPTLADLDRLIASPNPFSNRVRIDFVPRESGAAQLDLYDLRGMKMKGLFAGEVEADQPRSVEMESSGLTEGLYLVRLVNGRKVQHLKLIMVH